MAQGTRGRWMRVAAAGFGVLLSTNLVGCMGWDKSKDTKSTNKVTPGLPGLQTLPPGGNPAAAKTGQPGFGTGPGQPGVFNTAPVGSGPTRFGTNGINTNTSGSVQPIDNRPAAGNPGSIGAPIQPGMSQPQFGPVGAAPAKPDWNGGSASGSGSFSPPPPTLDPVLPPPAPDAFGSSPRGETGGVVNPPLPLGPVPVSPDQRPTISTGPGVFGDK